MKLVNRIFKWASVVTLVVVLVTGILLFIAYWRSTNDCERDSAVPKQPMKAITYCQYGLANLKLSDIEKPPPADDEVLVRVRASSVNPADRIYTGAARIVTGLRKPKVTRLGTDFAGTVESAGKNVTNFKAGDEVFGGKTGAFAQYVTVKANRAIAVKPSNVSFEEAGGVAIAGVTALQGLRDYGKIRFGQRALVNGASGGVGTFAVQIAKALGAEVTGVCSTKNLEMVRSIGADHVIDYTKQDFTQAGSSYDLLFDAVGNHSYAERRRVLTSNGVCVMAGVGGSGTPMSHVLGVMLGELHAYVRSSFTSQKFVTYIAKLNHADLGALADLMAAGKIRPVIDRTYDLSQVPAALQYLEQGHARGKVVITIP